jgi:RimJ/RimL family protein N-acetyltransferase
VTIELRAIDVRGADRGALVDFLTAGPWPFHVRTRPTPEQVAGDIDAGRFDGAEALWALADGVRIGLAVLEDVGDDTPTLDLRLAAAARGRGLGLPVLRAVTDHLFTDHPTARRFEAMTREDNVPMHRVLLRAGFVKEAHHREGWPVEDGPALASIGYAILRRDWATGDTTSVDWDDLVL